MFDAEKFNWMRDAIIALQRYYINNVNINLSEVKNYINMTVNGNLSWKFNINYEVSDQFIENWTEQTSEKSEEEENSEENG